jgi:uncharacterized membrane protein
MMFLFIAVALFCALHLVPALPSVKASLQDRFGPLYGPLFGLGATLSLVLIVFAWSQTEFEPVYEPSVWGRHINMAVSLIAFLFLGIFFFRGKLRLFFRFPFAIALIFWATGHLIANGDMASIILFGTLLAYAVIYIALALKNNVHPTLIMRDGHDVLALVSGVAAYIAMVQLHEPLIGMPVISISQIFSGS